MTVLAELVRLYDRLSEEGEAPPFGYAREQISGVVIFDEDGRLVEIRDLRRPDEKGKLRPRPMAVPAALGKRAFGIKPNLLWDKSSYALGVKRVENKAGDPAPGWDDERTRKEHKAFVQAQEEFLRGAEDPALRAFLCFLRRWRPQTYAERGGDPDLLGANFVFAFAGGVDEKRGPARFLHECDEVLRRVADRVDAGAGEGVCLVTGRPASIARLHPAIKGVAGAHTSGAAIVSFNLAAFTSYGKSQGANAPIGNQAAYAYVTALNTLLARGSGRRLQIGDATVVFWADAPAAEAKGIEDLLQESLGMDADAVTEQLRETLENIAAGRGEKPPQFPPDTKVFVLGLAPNGPRLVLRFWWPGTLGALAQNVVRFWDDLAQEPPAWSHPPAAGALLYETAVERKAENIPPRLGGELMRAVIAGADYPRSLLTATMMRIRAERKKKINPARVAIIAAYLRRNCKEDVAMALDRSNTDPAYRLGRLFAVLERIQETALPSLNATIRDRYFAAASATPMRVFPLLLRTANHHLSNLRKDDAKAGLARYFQSEIDEIMSALAPDLPRSLNLEDQGRFVIGYHHQRWARRTAPAKDESVVTQEEGALS